jgi:hypothetical protein
VGESVDHGGYWHGAYGSVAFAPNGDPLVLGPGGPPDGRVVRFDHTSTAGPDGTYPTIYDVEQPPSAGGTGSTNLGGVVYVQTSTGIQTLNTDTGQANGDAKGPVGNWGITANPVDHDVYWQSAGDQYSDPTLRSTGGCPQDTFNYYGYCYTYYWGFAGYPAAPDWPQGIYKLDPMTGQVSLFTNEQYSQPDQIAWDPTGQYLFASADGGVRVWDVNGHFQYNFNFLTDHGGLDKYGSGVVTDGIAFPAAGASFVVTNNTDGTISKFNFANGYAHAPSSEDILASGGSRGDNSGVGPDGCLYVTQAFTAPQGPVSQYTPSLVKVCIAGGGFAPPSGLGSSFTATEGTPFTGQVATFTDTNPADTALSAAIIWGDGSAPSPGAITGSPTTGYTVTGTHTYAHPSSPSITVSISGTSLPTSDVTTTGTVVDAPLTSDVSTTAITVPHSGQFNSVLGSFTDANPTGTASQFTATTDWGDGNAATTAPVVAGSAGHFNVGGSHLYANPGSYTTSTLVKDLDGGATTTVNRTVVVSEPNVVTITAQDASATYGGALPSSYGFSVTGLLPSQLAVQPQCGPASTPVDAASYAITCHGAAAGPNDTIVYADGTLTVAPKTFNVDANSVTAVYTGEVPALTATVTGISAALLQNQPTCLTAADGSVGSASITCSGADAGANYSPKYTGGTLTITRAPVVITADNQERFYGVADSTFTSQSSGLLNNDGLVSAGSCSVAGVHLAVGTYPIVCSGAGAGPNYAVSYSAGKLTVKPALLTITAASPTIVHGQATPAIDYTAVGLVSTDTLTTVPTCVAVTPNSSAGHYATSCSGAVASSNYVLSYNPGTLSVTAAAGTVTPDAQSKVYGDADPKYTYKVSGLVGTEKLVTEPTCGVATASHDQVAAGGYVIACKDADGGANYTVDQSATATLTVTPKALLVQPDNKTITFGEADPTFTFAVPAFVVGDGFTTAPVCSAAPHAHEGTYPITCTTGDAGGNYTVTTTTATLTVKKAVVTIAPDSLAVTYGQPVPALTYKLTGIPASSLLTKPVCSIPASGAHPAVGSYTISCTGATANGDYTVIQTATAQLTVNKAPLTVVVNNASRLYNQPNPAFTSVLSGLVTGDALSVTYDSGTTQASDVGDYTINATPSGAALGNYDWHVNPGTLTISKMATALVITSPAAQSATGPVTVSYRLTEAVPAGSTVPVNGQTVTMTAGGSSKTATGTTGSAGFSLTNGSYVVTASFAGSKNYLPSTAAAQTAFAYQPTTFVVWGGNTGGITSGKDYPFWGAQWSGQVTGGDYNAGSSFKGWANSATSTSWTTSPGGSGTQPATIGQYISVLVSAHASKVGSVISGDVSRSVLIKVANPSSYAPNPGHGATGAVQGFL